MVHDRTVESFEDAIELTAAGDGSYIWNVPDGWQVGRGAWGGLIIGALVRAVMLAETDQNRVVRSVSANLGAAALPTRLDIAVRLERSGSLVSVWTATATDEGKYIASMTAVLGIRRLTKAAMAFGSSGVLRIPKRDSAADVAEFDFSPPAGPPMGRHLIVQPISGMLRTGAPADTMGWVRLREPVPYRPATLFALADAWWPANFVTLKGGESVATVHYTASLLIDPDSLKPEDALLHHGYTTAANGGFASEHRQLWVADGRLAVDSVQSVVKLE